MTDHTPLTEQQLADIETRATAATAGPWCTDSWEIYQGTEYEPGISTWIGETCRGATTLDQDRADAAFVAAARTDVPALLAEVRQLRALAEDLAGRWEKEATFLSRAIGSDSLGGEVEAAQHERVRIYRESARDLRHVLATGQIPTDLLTADDRT